MNPRRHRSTAALGAILGAGLLAGGVAVAADVGSSTPTHVSGRTTINPDPNNVQPPTAGLDPAVLANYRVFRRSRTSGDTLQSNLSPGAKVAGANPSLARLGTISNNGEAIYLVPADGGFCVESTRGLAQGCDTAQQALSGATVEAVICSPGLPPGQLEVVGTLPDNATHAVARFEGGGSTALNVDNNVYVLTAPRAGALPAAVAWDAPDGHHELPANVPASSHTACSTQAAPPAPGPHQRADGAPATPPDLRLAHP